MKYLLKQNLSFLLAFLLVFSGMVFVFPQGNPQIASANAAISAVAAAAPAVAVARDVAQPKVEAVSRAQATLGSCGFSAQDAWLQNTVSAAFFTKPAGCFNIAPQKTVVAVQDLKVSNQPAAYPQIIVLNYPDRIQNELSIPVYPNAERSGVMPVAVALAVLMLSVFAKSDPEKKILKIKERPALSLTLEKLCLLRC